MPTLDTTDEFFAMARTGPTNLAVTKFVIPSLLDSDRVHWLDSNFFEFHDEWYWFRLLNGQPVAGGHNEPVGGLGFDTVAEVYAWAETQDLREGDALAEIVKFVDSKVAGRRLYSSTFYEVALREDERTYGVGSVVHFPANDLTAERWLMELGYTDEATADEVGLYLERLEATLPAQIADNLEWVVRSPEHEAVAATMTAEGHEYADRIVRYSELVPAGEVSVYNGGIAAGRLLLIEEGGAALTDAVDTDIVVVENAPDWLPPASALISSSPQTPLAHVNLLARNRGIPNVSFAGATTNDGIRQAARVRGYAIVKAFAADQLEIALITKEQYEAWLELQSTETLRVTQENAAAPRVIDLSEFIDGRTDSERRRDIDAWLPTIGGKAAGFLSLLAADGVTTPERPSVITIGAYQEHLDTVRPLLQAMLELDDFDTPENARLRFLLLEGPEDFAQTYVTSADEQFVENLRAKHSSGTIIGDLLDAGGFKSHFRQEPISPATLAEITGSLEDLYGDFAPTQGLRFRSSSSVEDIDGFSGAGLYNSNTGFLDPAMQDNKNDRKKSVEYALKKTWSSYWGFEAYEERRRENIDHVSGGMGVLVHARFDDDAEINNGVATFTLLPDNHSERAVVEINVQAGPVSVTNPDPTSGELPEVINVQIDANGQRRISRVAASTLSPGEDVLSDSAVLELVDQLETVTRGWLARRNTIAAPSTRSTTLALDFEFKTMADGWPALFGDVKDRAGGLMLKQARSLEPGLRQLPAEFQALPAPRDVLSRVLLIEEVRCGATTWLELFTNPLVAPDMGYSVEPLVVSPGRPDDLSSDSNCSRTVVFGTPDQFLQSLLEAGDLLNLSQ